MADWQDDIEYPTRPSGRASTRGGGGGLRREQRFLITLGVTAAVMLVIGVTTGFALGRATAPKPSPQPAPVAVTTAPADTTPSADSTPLVTDVTTPPADGTQSDIASTPVTPPVTQTTKPPKTPRTTAPDDFAKLSSSTVTLHWTKVTDPAGGSVTYSFDIQTWKGKTYGPSQTITGLTKNSYSKAKVLSSKRRWRVWAVGSDGKKSAKSSWSHFSAAAAKKSTTTTGTAN